MDMIGEQLINKLDNFELSTKLNKADLLRLIKEAGFNDLVMVVAKDGQRWAKQKDKGYFMYRGVTVECQINVPGELDLLFFDLAIKHYCIYLNNNEYTFNINLKV
ncbi:hypothetical protein NBT05_12425 [Aquimarina sp. ERC-38]|uniref:hypothetical protein n=1 Tax=Aquimarina sp. ERC-38 TaxID=2949996 RepID=UPI00224736F6|nr:hypothetical protein [Aquimarina sp. ERC-38]UZO79754.1 hypothetical protein NBT05_12425 [Aquimarina sp. ERC-38]